MKGKMSRQGTGPGKTPAKTPSKTPGKTPGKTPSKVRPSHGMSSFRIRPNLSCDVLTWN